MTLDDIRRMVREEFDGLESRLGKRLDDVGKRLDDVDFELNSGGSNVSQPKRKASLRKVSLRNPLYSPPSYFPFGYCRYDAWKEVVRMGSEHRFVGYPESQWNSVTEPDYK